MITVISGGVGGARFLQGLLQVVDPAEVTVIANTGDDAEFFGVYVSPDVDIVLYHLAGGDQLIAMIANSFPLKLGHYPQVTRERTLQLMAIVAASNPLHVNA